MRMINQNKQPKLFVVNMALRSSARVLATEPIGASPKGFLSAIGGLRFQGIDQEIAKTPPQPRSVPIPWKLLTQDKADEQ